MLDIKRIREDYDGVKTALGKRGKGDFGVSKAKALDVERRDILSTVEAMKNRQNSVSKEIPKLKKEGKDATLIMAEMKKLSDEIKELNSKLSVVEEELKETLLNIPNNPYKDVQIGEDDTDNVEIRKLWSLQSSILMPWLIGI